MFFILIGDFHIDGRTVIMYIYICIYIYVYIYNVYIYFVGIEYDESRNMDVRGRKIKNILLKLEILLNLFKMDFLAQ